MTRTLNAMETVAMAIADMNNNTPVVDPMDEYIEQMAYLTQVVDYDGRFDGDLVEQLKWERDTEEWLRKHSNNPSDPNYSEIYSDVFKDLYGFRPRW